MTTMAPTTPKTDVSYKPVRSTISMAPGQKPGYVVLGYQIEVAGWISLSPASKQDVTETVRRSIHYVLDRKVDPVWNDYGVKVVIETRVETAMLFAAWCALKDPPVLGQAAKDDDPIIQVCARLTQRAMNVQDAFEKDQDDPAVPPR